MRGRLRSLPSRCCQRASTSGRLFLACSSAVSAARRHRAELVLGQQRRALVVERQAVGVHVVEPDVVRAAGVGLGEEQDGGGDAGVGLEHAAGQRDHGVELLVLDQHLAQLLVRVARAEEHAVGHDDRGASAGLEQPQEQRQEEQLGLLGLDDLLQVLGACSRSRAMPANGGLARTSVYFSSSPAWSWASESR